MGAPIFNASPADSQVRFCDLYRTTKVFKFPILSSSNSTCSRRTACSVERAPLFSDDKYMLRYFQRRNVLCQRATHSICPRSTYTSFSTKIAFRKNAIDRGDGLIEIYWLNYGAQVPLVPYLRSLLTVPHFSSLLAIPYFKCKCPPVPLCKFFLLYTLRKVPAMPCALSFCTRFSYGGLITPYPVQSSWR